MSSADLNRVPVRGFFACCPTSSDTACDTSFDIACDISFDIACDISSDTACDISSAVVWVPCPRFREMPVTDFLGLIVMGHLSPLGA